MSTDNHFARHSLDRAAHRRRHPDWLAEKLEDPSTRFVPVAGRRHLVRDATGEPPEPRLLTPDEARALLPEAEVVFLAHESQADRPEDTEPAARFALVLPEEHPRARELGAWQGLRRLAPVLDDPTATLLATARAFAHWHHRHRFCGACGSPTENLEAGHLRRCTNEDCRISHFPRTDPAVIVLVTAGHGEREKALLARAASWPEGVHSTLAGFVEPGESLEAAVSREVLEETGVELDRVCYHSSQPWPFPGSIMIGFTARAAKEADPPSLRLDPEEIEQARWLTRDELARERAAGRIHLPSPISIARRLIEGWIGKGSG